MDNRHRFYAPLFAEHPHFDTFYRRFSLSIFFFFQQDRGRKIFLFFWWWKAEVLQRYLFCNISIIEPRLVKVSSLFVENLWKMKKLRDRGRKIPLLFWGWKAEVLQRYLFCNIFEARLVKISTLFVVQNQQITEDPYFDTFYRQFSLSISFFSTGLRKDDHLSPFDDERLRFCKDIYFAILWILSSLDW